MAALGPVCRPALRRRIAIAAIMVALGLGSPALAADSDATAEALIVKPFTLVKDEDLDFGSLVSGATGGTVTINAASGARTGTGGVTLIGSGQRAVFQGAATPGTFVQITGSTSATLARVGGGAAPMTATLTRSYGPGIFILFGNIAFVTTGAHTYYVGGTLNVPANQMPGDYNGTFTLTVNYY